MQKDFHQRNVIIITNTTSVCKNKSSKMTLGEDYGKDYMVKFDLPRIRKYVSSISPEAYSLFPFFINSQSMRIYVPVKSN